MTKRLSESVRILLKFAIIDIKFKLLKNLEYQSKDIKNFWQDVITPMIYRAGM